MMNRIDRAVREIQEAIDITVEHLDDDDFLEVMDEIASYCESSAAAKREERGE